MACACGKKTDGTKTTYVVRASDGTTKTYSTELEAKAAALRVNGTWRAQ